MPFPPSWSLVLVAFIPLVYLAASLQTLTSSTGEVSVTAPNGVQQTWFTARLQQPQAAAAGNPASPEEVISTP